MIFGISYALIESQDTENSPSCDAIKEFQKEGHNGITSCNFPICNDGDICNNPDKITLGHILNLLDGIKKNSIPN